MYIIEVNECSNLKVYIMILFIKLSLVSKIPGW